MSSLNDLLDGMVGGQAVPGAVGLVARDDRIEVAAAGFASIEDGSAMARDSIFRIASLTKPILAAAVMMLVDDGRIKLDDPVDEWLPELGSPSVVRDPDGPVDDVVPADRQITVFDLLSSCAGHGFSSDASQPAVRLLMSEAQTHNLHPQRAPAPDAWLAKLAAVPLLHQPGRAWLYNVSSDVQGVLVARVSGLSLPEFLDERVFAPLGMADTGFSVPSGKLDRFTSFYRGDADGGFALADPPGGEWSSAPAFPAGSGGLVSTVDDWFAFARMLLADGTVDGERLLSFGSVRLMTTNRLTPAQRQDSDLFLEGQGWGFGGAVDVDPVRTWVVPGRYGWIGGTGTCGHLTPSTGTVGILFTQSMMAGPATVSCMRDFWRFAAAF